MDGCGLTYPIRGRDCPKDWGRVVDTGLHQSDSLHDWPIWPPAGTMGATKSALLQQAITEAGAAAFDPSRWFRCMEIVSALTASSGAALFRPEPGTQGCHAAVGSMSAGATDYFTRWIHQDPWNGPIARIGRFRTAGETLIAEDVVTRAELLRTSYYNEHARYYESGQKLFLKVCDAADEVAPVTHVTLSRAFGQPNYGDEETSIMRKLWPHLRTAARAAATLRAAGVAAALSESGLELLPQPCFALRKDGTIDFMNDAAAVATRSGIDVSIVAGRLVGIGALQSDRWSATLRRVATGLAVRQVFAVDHGSPARLVRAVASALPLRHAATHALAWPHASVLLILELPDVRDDQAWIEQQLAVRYRLTPTEAAVLDLLTQGHEPRGIADQLRVTELTARTHLRSLREKTGRHSLASLVRLGLGR